MDGRVWQFQPVEFFQASGHSVLDVGNPGPAIEDAHGVGPVSIGRGVIGHLNPIETLLLHCRKHATATAAAQAEAHPE